MWFGASADALLAWRTGRQALLGVRGLAALACGWSVRPEAT